MLVGAAEKGFAPLKKGFPEVPANPTPRFNPGEELVGEVGPSRSKRRALVGETSAGFFSFLGLFFRSFGFSSSCSSSSSAES